MMMVVAAVEADPIDACTEVLQTVVVAAAAVVAAGMVAAAG